MSTFNEHLRQVHHRTIKQIAVEDPELSTRAVNLKQTDEQNMQQFESLLHRVTDLPERVSQAEPDEGQMEAELQELVNDGLKFVLSVRGQETVMNTWMNKSLYRDRGAAD